ncbi:MAG: hypothetical protein QXS18_05590, partial [Thermoplasmata archaeon]
MERLNEIEIRIKCGFCGYFIKNPLLWQLCPKCKAILMTSYKSVAKKENIRNFKKNNNITEKISEK